MSPLITDSGPDGPIAASRSEQARARGLRWAVALLFVAAVIGYPVAGLFAVLTGVDSTDASIPFRLIVLGLAGTLILQHLRSLPRPSLPQLLLLLFWLAYALRLVAQVLSPEASGSGRALSLFIAASVVPCVALMLSARHWSEETGATVMLIVGSLIVFAALTMYSLELGGERNLMSATGRLSFETVNAITLGHVAATTVIAVYFKALSSSGRLWYVVLASSALVALTVLVLSGSKGPALALVVVIAVAVLVTPNRRSITVAAAILAGLACLSAVPTETLNGILLRPARPAVVEQQAPQEQGVTQGQQERKAQQAEPPRPQVPTQGLGERLVSATRDLSTSKRMVLYESAVDQVLASPWLGTPIVQTHTNAYPHNLFIEAALALGIPAMLVLGGVIVAGLLRVRAMESAGCPFVALILVQYLVASQFSGAIYGAAPLWAPLALALTVPVARRREPQRSRQTISLGSLKQGEHKA